eukprot:9039797-Pyramimonas_sp.AAC.1
MLRRSLDRHTAKSKEVDELNQAVAELEIKLGDKKSALVQANTELQNIQSEVHLARTAVLAATAQPVGSDVPSVQEAMGRLQTVVAGASAAILAGNSPTMLQTLQDQLAQLQSAVQAS